MDPSRPDRILDEWNAVAGGARRPATPPRRVAVRAGSAGLSLAGAGVVAVVLLATAVWLGRPGSTGPGAVVPDAARHPRRRVETPAPSGSADSEPQRRRRRPRRRPTPTVAPTPTATPTIGACTPGGLAAKITLWEGAAGSRIATRRGDQQWAVTPRTLEKLERRSSSMVQTAC